MSSSASWVLNVVGINPSNGLIAYSNKDGLTLPGFYDFKTSKNVADFSGEAMTTAELQPSVYSMVFKGENTGQLAWKQYNYMRFASYQYEGKGTLRFDSYFSFVDNAFYCKNVEFRSDNNVYLVCADVQVGLRRFDTTNSTSSTANFKEGAGFYSFVRPLNDDFVVVGQLDSS